MRIVMTGASSFTGMWIAEALSKREHDVIAFLKRDLNSYSGIRKSRVDRLKKSAVIKEGISFGAAAFFKALEDTAGPIDLFCHHAADVADYRSPEFNYVRALEANTYNLPGVLKALEAKGCRHIILTGSVFERGEGEGSQKLEAMSPYGLSKGLTYETFRYFCQRHEFFLGKFVIPNPFGPYEEDRFTSYLMREWLQGKTPIVKTPDYVRDNVPAPLLASAYVDYAESFIASKADERFSPSFYRESQGDFTLRYALEAKKRLNLPCHTALAQQTDFNEPLVRVNKHPLDRDKLQFDEEAFFDENTLWYQRLYQPGSLCAAQSS
ncbi:NAD-dependent epimerase/dehydratase family protein [Estrella lausannensis]|uniref:Putative NAD-dependent epimerase/dehydratase n=1 Tax=Estrella lausannensis TaxID=483423 RepID=A0A0H5DNS6_9BACT|nr:NAD(P)-dependent oxidoreductase [Estrella lausannensis]CRX37473.1 Putative NAD-dependent epimerase/dehydratase [Estrella lausannensis]